MFWCQVKVHQDSFLPSAPATCAKLPMAEHPIGSLVLHRARRPLYHPVGAMQLIKYAGFSLKEIKEITIKGLEPEVHIPVFWAAGG